MELQSLILVIVGYLALINVVAFTLFGIDKFKAKHNMWRIPEKVLFSSAFLGGGIGALLGMNVFRHKTQHLSFKVIIPLAIVCNVLMVGFIFFLTLK